MTAAAKQELIGKAKRSGLLMLLQRASYGVLRLGSNMILAALLFPEAFGLMMLVNVFLIGLNLFSDTGMGPSIVRSKRGEEPAFYNTAFTIQVGRGVLLSVLCLLLAGPYASWFGKHELVHLIQIGALTPLIVGFRSPHWFSVDRQQTLGRKVSIEIVAQFAGSLTMILWALATERVESLVVGGVVQALVTTAASHIYLKGGPVRLHFEREASRELWSFGRWIFLSTALNFLAMQSDRLLMGGLLPGFWLGLFGIAIGLLSISSHLIQGLSASVVFPTWMNSQRMDPDEHLWRMRRSRSALLWIALAVLVAISAGAPALFRLFYDDRYQGAILIIQLLCLATWFSTLITTSTASALVFGDSRATTQSNFITLLTKVPFCYLGFVWGESLSGGFAGALFGFTTGMAVSNMVGAWVLGLALRRHGLLTLRDDCDKSLLALLYFQLTILPRFLPLEGVALLAVEVLWGSLLLAAVLWPARAFLKTILSR